MSLAGINLHHYLMLSLVVSELHVVYILKQIGSDSVLIATVLTMGPIIQALSSLSLLFIHH